MGLSSVQPFTATTTTTTTVIVIITVLHLFSLLPTLYCSKHYPPPPPSPDITTQGLLVVEKTRLGSTPPSCYNKCNKCHPCMAVQVPTLPNHGRAQPASASTMSDLTTHAYKPKDNYNYFDSLSSLGGEGNNRYSNYKPLGWKCRCNGHFYNP